MFRCSNGGSDKQHLDSSDESDLDTPMHNSSNNTSTTQSNSNTQQTAQQQQHQLHIGGSGGGSGGGNGGGGQHHHHHQHNQHGHHGPNLNSSVDGSGLLVGNSNLSHSNNSTGSLSGLSSQGKNIGQMPALSAVAYSHLHSVMGAGSMPLYDISDYQHL